MMSIKTMLKELAIREEGQGLVETGLIYTLVSVASISVLAALGGQLQSVYQDLSDVLSNVG